MIRIKKYISIALLLMGGLILMFGCAEDESPVTPTDDLLQLTLISPTGSIPYHGTATYSWNTRGGAGTYSFSYTLTGQSAVATSNSKVTFTNLEAGDYLFSVIVTDTKNNTNSADSDTLTVLPFDSSAIDTPTIAITNSPLEGKEVPLNVPVTLGWESTDPSLVGGGIKGYVYKLENVTSTTVIAEEDSLVLETTRTFENLTEGDYVFTITTTNFHDVTASDTATFTVKVPYILWLDDHHLGPAAAINSEEFVEKANDWGAALNGFAWQEYDVYENNPTLTDMDNLVSGSTFETIIWDQDGSVDNDLMEQSLNDSAGTTNTPWLHDFLDNGGNLVLVGANIPSIMVSSDTFTTGPRQVIGEHLTPATGDFEDVYMGIIPDYYEESIDSTVYTHEEWINGEWETVIDSVIYDSSYTFPYADNHIWHGYGGYTTLTGTNGYTDITIDVAKDENTHQDGVAFLFLQNTIKPIILDGDGEVVGYVYDPPTTAGRVVVLGMNLYYSPSVEIRDIIQKILTDEFGY